MAKVLAGSANHTTQHSALPHTATPKMTTPVQQVGLQATKPPIDQLNRRTRRAAGCAAANKTVRATQTQQSNSPAADAAQQVVPH